jgi:small conductance mechanosensitive channel
MVFFESAWTWKVLMSLLTFAGGYIVIVLFNSAVFKNLKHFKKFDEGTANFLFRLIKVIEWIIVFLIILAIFKVPLTGLLTSLGIAGFIVGFALKDVLGNLAAGVMIMVHRPFLVGDWIQVGKDISGTVKDIGISAIEIKTFRNEKIVVPNGSVWGNPITNFSAYATRKIVEDVCIPYEASIDKAVKLILKLLDKEPRVLDEPEFQVVVKEMANSAVVLSVRAWVKNSDYWPTVFDLRKQLKESLSKAGIEIPFPQMDVHVKKH